MRSRLWRGAGLAFALAWLGLGAIPAAWAAESITIATVDAASAMLWPLYIGEAKGFFLSAGVVPDLIFVPSNAGTQQQLAAGSVNLTIGSGLVDPVRAISQGAPIAIIRIDAQAAPYALLGARGLKGIKELAGKTLIVGGAKDITRTYLDLMLRPNGLRPGQYDLVYAGATSARYAALQSGTVAAALLTAPYNFRAEKAGYPNLGLAVDYAPDLPFAGTVVNRTWASAHLSTVRAFLAAYTKSMQWFYGAGNRAEAIKILADPTHQEPDTVAESYDFFRRINLFEPTGKVSQAKLGNVVKALQGMGDLDPAFDPARLVMPGVTELAP